MAVYINQEALERELRKRLLKLDNTFVQKAFDFYPADSKAPQQEGMPLHELIAKANIPRERFGDFDFRRLMAFETALQVYENRVVGYNVDHHSFQEMVYGPVSLASEIYKRSKRLAGLLTPLRQDPLREEDINRILDTCIDIINYTSWMFSLVSLATESTGNENSSDAPDYIRDLKKEADRNG